MFFSKKFSSICIMAGSPSNDFKAARIMKQIKKQSPQTKFFGIGGPYMQAEGLSSENSYADINKFLDKPFIPLKNFLRTHIEKPWHPLMAKLHYRNGKVLDQLEKNSFFSDLHLHKPSAFLTVGNEFFAKDVYCLLNQFYEQHDQIKPPCILQEKWVHNQRTEFKWYLDHFLFTVPKEQVNWRYSIFPSTNVGQEGVFRAYEFLYKQNQHFLKYLKENTIPLSETNQQEIIEQLVKQVRNQFRQKNDLSEDCYVFFLAPGNTKQEIDKNLKLFKNGIQHFIKKSGIDISKFAVVVSLQQKQNIEMPIKMIITDNQDEKFEAMAGSDMGVAVNGDIVNECAAMQLPTLVINEVNFIQAYFTLLYNQFNSDLNFSLSGMIQPELMASKFGDAFPEKVSDFINDFVKQPKTRYVIANKMSKAIIQMIPKQDQKVNDNEIIIQEEVFFNCVSPDYLSAKKVLEASQVYQSLNQKVKRHQIELERKQMLQKLAWN